ncbi:MULTISPECIES: CPXCG motif-containing cysteine-rich protein [Lysobacter]|uniref:CPXCG motif-containing cysteine-rich protein n=1 Tax=Lysobacter firmicutimachus TaxID=1792846 RepID=A0ABU8CYE3_9GAMM|nr:CPXCG motif-containing cysteine-rich protein [Lysobacter antibioticus]
MLPGVEVQCPYCGEAIVLLIDDSAGDQRYIEDCQVCCRPIVVDVQLDEDGVPDVTVHAEDEA